MNSSTPMLGNRSGLAWATLMLLAAGMTTALSGCASPAPPREPAPVESAPLRSLDEFAELVAGRIVNELPDHPEVTRRGKRVLGMGPIRVRGFTNMDQFEACAYSIRTKITNNAGMARRFRIVVVTDTQADAIIRETGGQTASSTYIEPDLSNVDDVMPAQYHPDDVFALTGDFYSLNPGGGDRQSFVFMVNVVHARTRTTVLAHEYRRDVQWNSRDGRWYVRD